MTRHKPARNHPWKIKVAKPTFVKCSSCEREAVRNNKCEACLKSALLNKELQK